MGQQVIVDNRGGAGGIIGTEIAAQAPADGYTLVAGHLGTLAVNASLYPRLSYDPVGDFAPITLFASLPLVLVVNSAMPVATVSELVQYAKARPGTINYGSAGAGGPTHLAAALFQSATDIDIVHVPYKGNAAALSDLLAGEVQMMFSNLLTAMPHTRTGKLRALGISSAERSPQQPDLPTIAESGIRGFDFTAWFGILAPARHVRSSKLNTEIGYALRAPGMKDRFAAQGADLAPSTPEAFEALIATDLRKWPAIIKTHRIVP